MADPKNPPKGSRSGLRNNSETEDGSGDKSRNRDKYRTPIPRQTNQTQSRAQNPEAQKARGTGNYRQEGTTLTDSEITRTEINPTQPGANKIGISEENTKSGPQDQVQHNTQAEHFDIDEEVYSTPQ